MKRQQRESSLARVSQEVIEDGGGSLKHLLSQNQLGDIDENHEEGKKLLGILMKNKKERLRDIFIQKMKRVVISNSEKLEINKNGDQYRFAKYQKRGIILPDFAVHIVVVVNILVVLILLWLTSIQQFNKNLRSNINYGLVQGFKIACLVLNVIGFLLKCVSKSFHSQLDQNYIRNVVMAYAKSGRLFLDLVIIIFEILTLALSRTTLVSALFSIVLVISLFYIVPDMLKIETAYLHSEKAVLIWGLAKVCFGNLVLAHILAEILLAMSWIDPLDNWLIKAQINNSPWYIQYFYAVYWGTTIMMTVGFGDMLPSSEGEVIIVTFLEMFSCIVLGYNISQIGNLLSQLRQKDELVNKKMAIFDRIVKSRPVTEEETQEERNQKIILYKSIYSYIYQLNNSESNLDYQRRNQFLEELPEHLKKAYYYQNNRIIFSGVLFFSNLKRKTLEQMGSLFQSRFYHAGEILLQIKSKIMILELGQIGLAYKKKGSTVNGKFFDSLAVKKSQKSKLMSNHFLNIARDLNYFFVAKNKSIVWSINYDDFMSVLQESSIDFQYYFSLYHKHIINEDEWNIVECPRCSTPLLKNFHFVYGCPKITYKPLKSIILMKTLSVDSKICLRNQSNTKRNKYVKISALKYKINFKKVEERLRIDRKRQMVVLQGDKAMKSNMNNQKIPTISLERNLPEAIRNEILELIEIGIKNYKQGFEEGFWNLETDLAENYLFYFPQHNASNLIQEEVNAAKFGPKTIKSVKELLMGKFSEQAGFYDSRSE